MGLQETIHRGIPLLCLLIIHKRHQIRHHPVVALLIHHDGIGLAGLSSVLDHVSVLPSHLTRLRVHAVKFTVARSHQQGTVPVCHRRDIQLLGQQSVLVAVFCQGVFLSPRNITIESLVVGLHPDIFLGVDIEAVDTTFHTVFRQLSGGVSLTALGLRIEQRVVHTLPQP